MEDVVLPTHDQLRCSPPGTTKAPLVEKITSQSHILPDENKVKQAKNTARLDREPADKDNVRNVKASLQKATTRAPVLAAEKEASTWLTVVPLKNMGFVRSP